MVRGKRHFLKQPEPYACRANYHDLMEVLCKHVQWLLQVCLVHNCIWWLQSSSRYFQALQAFKVAHEARGQRTRHPLPGSRVQRHGGA